MKHDYIEDDKNILFIIVESFEQGDKYIENFDLIYPAYVVVIGQENRVEAITKTAIYLETARADFFDTLFRCILQRPLVVSLRNCIRSIKGGNKISKELVKIISIEPVINISVGSEVEVGKSVKVIVSMEPDVGIIPNLIYKIQNQELASCDGFNIYGLKEGTSIFEVYKSGSSKPFFEKKINIFKRNRINRLIFSDDSLLIGVGDEKRIQLDYYPQDADNINDITWTSSDPSIVTVNNDGNLTAKNPGKCRIICTAENISAQCICIVKPYMEKLDICEEGCIYMAPMQKIILSPKVFPRHIYRL